METAATYKLEKQFQWNGILTDKAVSVMKMFGVDLPRLQNESHHHKCELRLGRGDVCYITGASGSGKSVLLRELYGLIPAERKIILDEINLSEGLSLIDCIEGDYIETLKLLSKAGLNDVFTVLNQPVNLSEGQKYRFRLAKAIASGKQFVFADEFCSGLDRITAAVISHNLSKFAKRHNITFVLASSHDDIIADLSPDVIVIKHLNGTAEVIYRNLQQ